jgi:hypothetical protein
MAIPGFAPAQRVFPCPHCKEFINTSMSECKFCGTAVDYEAAQRAAEIQEQTAKACSDANYLKVTARTMPIFYLVSWVPIIGGIAGWGFLFLLFAVPIMAALWLVAPPYDSYDRPGLQNGQAFGMDFAHHLGRDGGGLVHCVGRLHRPVAARREPRGRH